MSDESASGNWFVARMKASERAMSAGFGIVMWNEGGWKASKGGRDYEGQTPAELDQVVAAEAAGQEKPK
jgi:hypothetical protein